MRVEMEEKNVTVSIVTPVYNAGAYIEETIRSVQNQSFSDWELLLVDDASRDDGPERIRQAAKEDARIRFFALEHNQGAARARNYGTGQARGRYLAFLDADDIWLPRKLERQLAFLWHTGAAFTCTAYEFGDEQAAGTGKIVHVPEKLTYRQALSRTVVFTSTTLFDTEKLPPALLQMPDIKSEDTATWWQIMRAGYPAFGLDESLTIYRRPAGSLSSNKWKAIGRIWRLYREREGLSPFRSLCCFVPWALRATLRRL